MATMTAEHREKARQALKRAEHAKQGKAAVRRDVRFGRLPLSEAIFDRRAGCLTVETLLLEQRRMGTRKMLKIVRTLQLNERKRIDSLTDRQRRVLADACR